MAPTERVEMAAKKRQPKGKAEKRAPKQAPKDETEVAPLAASEAEAVETLLADDTGENDETPLERGVPSTKRRGVSGEIP